MSDFTIDELHVGVVLKNTEEAYDYRKVLGVCGSVIFLSNAYDSYSECLSAEANASDMNYTMRNLRTWKICYKDEEPPVELTKEEASRIIAKIKKVDVRRVRIKE